MFEVWKFYKVFDRKVFCTPHRQVGASLTLSFVLRLQWLMLRDSLRWKEQASKIDSCHVRILEQTSIFHCSGKGEKWLSPFCHWSQCKYIVILLYISSEFFHGISASLNLLVLYPFLLWLPCSFTCLYHCYIFFPVNCSSSITFFITFYIKYNINLLPNSHRFTIVLSYNYTVYLHNVQTKHLITVIVRKRKTV